MTENETTERLIPELCRKSSKRARALDPEETTIESFLRIIGEGRSWSCAHCGREPPEGIREQAIEDFVRLELDKWGFVNPQGLDKFWGHFVRDVTYHYNRERDGGPMGDGRYFCSTTCEQAERDAQEPMTGTLGEYGWCSDHEMPIDERLISRKDYRCLDCEHVESAEDIEWFSIEEYAAEHKISTWKVRQMIKSGEVDARLMDKTRAWSPITRSIAPLKKWFIIVRKTIGVSE